MRLGDCLAELIQAERSKWGWTQDDLAAAAGITDSMISLMESKHRLRQVNLESLKKIAVALGYERVGEFIDEAEARYGG